VLQTPEEINWQTCLKDGNQYLQEFTAPGHMRFTNIGTLPVKPQIKLLGNITSGLNIAYNGMQWQYNAGLRYDSIVIDCVAETVTRGSDGANLMPYVDAEKDAFFNLQPGQINIDVTATGLGTWPQSLIVIVTFDPMGV
jgi:phage-related protein